MTKLATPLFALCAVALVLVGAISDEGTTVGVLMNLPLVIASAVACRFIDRDKLDLVGTFLLAVMLRWLVAAFVHIVIYKTQNGLFAPDEVFYNQASRYYAEHLAGHVPDPYPDRFAGGVIWWTSLFYFVAGYAPMAPALLNGLFGGWTAVVTGLIANRVFSPAVGRQAGLIAAIVPSLVLWSSLNIKDTSTLLGAEMSLYAFIELRARLRPEMVALLLGGVLLTAVSRSYEVVFIGAGVMSGLASRGGRRSHAFRNVLLSAMLAVALLVIVRRTGGFDVATAGDESTVERINSIRDGYSLGAGSAVSFTAINTGTPLGLIAWSPFGLIYFFLAPIPFTGGSTIAVATTPEMLVWYWLLPSVIRGLRLAIRHRARAVTPLLAYLLVSSIGWSVVVTNVGTLYRYRAQVLFVPIMFIAADRVRRKVEKAQAAAIPSFTLPPVRAVSAARPRPPISPFGPRPLPAPDPAGR